MHVKQFKPCENVKDPTLKYETLGVDHVSKDTYQMFGNIVSEQELGGKLRVCFSILSISNFNTKKVKAHFDIFSF